MEIRFSNPAVLLNIGGVFMIDDRYYLELAIQEAEISLKEGTYPIGALIVSPDGEILSKGRNMVLTTFDPTAHAEICAIRNAGKLLFDSKYKNKCTLYVSAEPCPMCSGAIILSDIARVVWALSDNYLGALRHAKLGEHFKHKYDKVSITPEPYYDLAIKQENLGKKWEASRGNKYLASTLQAKKD